MPPFGPREFSGYLIASAPGQVSAGGCCMWEGLQRPEGWEWGGGEINERFVAQGTADTGEKRQWRKI